MTPDVQENDKERTLSMGTLPQSEVTRYWEGSGPGRGSVLEKPLTVWSRRAETPPQVHMMVLDLEVISESPG